MTTRPNAVLLTALLIASLGAIDLGRPTEAYPPLASDRENGQEPQAEVDLLTFARGVVFVSQEGLAVGSAGRALLSIDGDPYRLGLTTDAALPVAFAYKLPAPTTFHRFAVPGVQEWPGNVTFVKSVVVMGSSEGPDEGYRTLAEFELATHASHQEVTEAIVPPGDPVRWIKIHFDGGINIGPGDEGRTNIRFTELIGNGTQETPPFSTVFDGLWAFRQAERLDGPGIPIALRQDGTTIRGCYGDYRFTGTVNGVIARANGEDSRGRSAHLVLVADGNGAFQGSVSLNGGRFRPLTAVEDPAVEQPSCAPEEPAEPRVCGTNAYINFDLDSAAIRPESEAVLRDVFARLRSDAAERVTIVGHTSTEGDETYNMDLSRRRAESVVRALVELGYDSATISASGMGESQPLVSPDASETTRELNRRVEISCS
ncbi:MAG: OmpA family protein [Gemmatimonadetes bacterium]|nr:OmpA family protein [Gemmatimonadota bacterium]